MVKIGEIKVSVQELGIKQGVFFLTEMEKGTLRGPRGLKNVSTAVLAHFRRNYNRRRAFNATHYTSQ